MFNEFKVVSGKLIVSDPCYGEGTWCQKEVENVKNGIWVCEVERMEDDVFGDRICKLVARYKDYTDSLFVLNEEYIDTLCVDSGQMGVFDKQFYRNDAQFEEGITPKNDFGDEDSNSRLFYGFCCDATLSNESYGVLPYGCVSSSGFGDGCYDGTVYRNDDDEAIAVEIVFIDEDDCDDEFDKDESDDELDDN